MKFTAVTISKMNVTQIFIGDVRTELRPIHTWNKSSYIIYYLSIYNFITFPERLQKIKVSGSITVVGL